MRPKNSLQWHCAWHSWGVGQIMNKMQKRPKTQLLLLKCQSRSRVLLLMISPYGTTKEVGKPSKPPVWLNCWTCPVFTPFKGMAWRPPPPREQVSEETCSLSCSSCCSRDLKCCLNFWSGLLSISTD